MNRYIKDKTLFLKRMEGGNEGCQIQEKEENYGFVF